VIGGHAVVVSKYLRPSAHEPSSMGQPRELRGDCRRHASPVKLLTQAKTTGSLIQRLSLRQRVGLRLYAPRTVAASFDCEPTEVLGDGRAAQVAGVEAAIWAETISASTTCPSCFCPACPAWPTRPGANRMSLPGAITVIASPVRRGAGHGSAGRGRHAGDTQRETPQAAYSGEVCVAMEVPWMTLPQFVAEQAWIFGA